MMDIKPSAKKPTAKLLARKKEKSEEAGEHELGSEE
jgi:hypothetical protein